MRRSAKKPEIDLDLRPKVTVGGISCLLGIAPTTLYDRIRQGALNLDSVPSMMTQGGRFYDLESIIRRFLPTVDDERVTTMMFEFMQENGGLVR